MQSCAADNMPVDVVLMDRRAPEAVKNFWMRLQKSVQSASYMYPAIRRRWSATVPIWKKQGYRAKEVWPVDNVPLVGGGRDGVFAIQTKIKAGYF